MHMTLACGVVAVRETTTQPPVVDAEPPQPCALLDLTPLLDADLKVDSILWDVNGAVVTLSCPLGSHFVEGGTSRTLVCQNGKWPSAVPRCTGVCVHRQTGRPAHGPRAGEPSRSHRTHRQTWPQHRIDIH